MTHIVAMVQRMWNLQLEVLELAKKKLGGALNALLEFLSLLRIQPGSEELDLFLDVGNKLLLVKGRLLLQNRGSTNQHTDTVLRGEEAIENCSKQT